MGPGKFEYRESSRIRGLGQPVVPANEAPPRGTLFAPNQGRSKLQAIGSPQGMLIQQTRRQFTNLVAGKDFPPRQAEQSQTCHRALFIVVRYLVITMEAADSAVNFYQASPPHHRRESPEMGLRMTTRGFVNTQGD